jgi:hypothetical protein
MIVVNLKRLYPDVLAGNVELADVSLGDWYQITDSAIKMYGDVIVGVFEEKVVSAYDVLGHARGDDQRVRFEGTESEEFAGLIGKRSPATPWQRGQGRPIKYVPTDVVRKGDAEVTAVPEEPTALRAVVKGYVLTVDADGLATLEMPNGGAVAVLSSVNSGVE